MNKKQSVLLGGAALCAVLLFCAKEATFTNPVDPANPTHVVDSLLQDRNGNGIADYYDLVDTTSVIKDKTPPVITFIGGDTVIIARNDPNFSKVGYSATDNVDGNLTAAVVASRDVYTSQCSTYVVTYSVSDKAGNKAQKTRVIIVDCEGPVITLSGRDPDTIAVGRTYIDPGASAKDAVSGTATVTKSAAPNTSVEGIDTIFYSAVDKVGNKSTATRVLVVYKPAIIDSIKPVIVLIGSRDTSIKMGTNWSEPGFSATDNIDGVITSKVTVTGIVNAAAPGVYTVTYSVSDNAGNAAIAQTRKVTVVKPGGGPPVITLKGKSPDTVAVKAGAVYTDPGYSAVDGAGTDLTASVVVTELFNKTKPYSIAAPTSYTFVYTVTDKDNKTTTLMREVYVVGQSNDKTPPSITLSGKNPDTVKLGSGKYTDPGFTATDDVDGVITGKVQRVYKNELNAVVDSLTFATSIGAHTITYSVADAAGNQATPKTRNVWVKDSATIPAQVLLDKYGVPLTAALPTVATTSGGNMVYTKITTDGTGAPSMASVQSFTFKWRNESINNQGLDDFSFRLAPNGSYQDLRSSSTLTQTFAQPSPGLTLTGTGISGLDGSYYIKADATQCVWVKKDGSFAVVFKP